MCVYKITNLANGKIYIGKTVSKNVRRRLNQHLCDALGKRCLQTPFHRAIRAHGKQNFVIESIEEHTDEQLLIERETYWILALSTTKPTIGYNVYASWKDFSLLTPYESGALKKRTRSNYGVLPIKGSFRVTVTFEGESYNKSFKTQQEAAQAYDKLSVYFRGADYHYLNYPEQAHSYTAEDLDACHKLFTQRTRASKYRGLTRGRIGWHVSIKVNYRPISTRSFATETEAAEAYDKITLFLRGNEHFELNFPGHKESYLEQDLKAFYEKAVERIPKSSSCKYVGYHKSSGKWHCRFKGDFIGAFDTESEACIAAQQLISTAAH